MNASQLPVTCACYVFQSEDRKLLKEVSKNGEGRAEEVLELVTEVCVLHGIYTAFPQCNFEPEIPHKI